MEPVDPIAERELALQVLQRLRERGFEAFWAGGCVRDQLLGRLPKDYDVASNATPEQVVELFGKRRTLLVGAAFGVVIVRGSRGKGQVEVATFRQDAEYGDGRHPDSVSFSTPEHDAQRRDFTINGLFYDPLADRVIDFVGGQADLARRIVRAIGDPRARFREDKLRMLRAVRIAATFGFELDTETLQAIREMAGEIVVVSAERIAQEMRKLLTCSGRRQGLELLAASELLAPILPELLPLRERVIMVRGSPVNAWTQTLSVLANLHEPEFPLALATTLHLTNDAFDMPQAQTRPAEDASRRWKLSNAEAERVIWLVDHRDALHVAPTQRWPVLQRLLISDECSDLIALETARAATGDGVPADAEYCRQRLALPADELNPPPLLTGDNLIAHGVPPSKSFKTLLEAVRDAQLEGTVQTREEALALVDRLRAGQS